MKKSFLSLCLAAVALFSLSACQKQVSFGEVLTESAINEISLPQVLSKTEVSPAIVLSIRQGNIYLGQTMVAFKSDLTRPDSYGSRGLVANLYSALFTARQQWINLFSGTTTKLADVPYLGFNRIPAEVQKSNIEAYLNPPLLIASDGSLTLSELTAIMSTARQASITNFNLLVVNRADGLFSQEEIQLPGQVTAQKMGRPTIDFVVRILADKLIFSDTKDLLLGPNGEANMTVVRRPSGLFDEQELANHLQTIKRQFPTTSRANIGGQGDTKLSILIELLAQLRCERNSDGSCEKGYFPDIAIWPADYESYLLGPIEIQAD